MINMLKKLLGILLLLRRLDQLPLLLLQQLLLCLLLLQLGRALNMSRLPCAAAA